MFSMLLVPLLTLQFKNQEAPPPPKPNPAVTRPAPSKPMAMVNNQPITAGEVENYLWDWKSDEVVQTLINFRIVDIEAKRLGITITPQELQTQIDQALEQTKRSHPNELNPWKVLGTQGYPESRVRLTLKNILLLNKITERDFKPNDFVDISMIMVKPKTASAEDTAAAQKAAQDYYDKIQKGAQWSVVLASSTTDANAVKEDGRLGLRALSLFPPAASAELLKLKPGQITHPVQTQVGIQIFKLNRLGSTASPAELDRVKQEFVQQHEKDVLTKLRNAAKIVTIN